MILVSNHSNIINPVFTVGVRPFYPFDELAQLVPFNAHFRAPLTLAWSAISIRRVNSPSTSSMVGICDLKSAGMKRSST